MGLDSQLTATRHGDYVVLHEWRKNYQLNSFMWAVYMVQNPEARFDPEDPFNGGLVNVTMNYLHDLECRAMRGDFDVDYYDIPSLRDTNAALFRMCKVLLDNGYKIHYSCSY